MAVIPAIATPSMLTSINPSTSNNITTAPISAPPLNPHTPFPKISDVCYLSLILICIACFLLVMSVFIQHLKKEGFFISDSPGQANIDVQIMEQGLLIRKKKAGGSSEKKLGKREIVVFKGYGSVEG